ncbi:MAG: DUF7507 domain-containing protein, partial [Phycicoccus sp.]
MRERRHVAARRRVVAAVAVVAACLAGGIVAPAFAYQVNTAAVTGTTGTNGNALITFPGGTTATVQSGGLTTVSTVSSTLAGRGATVGMFDPQVSTSTSMPELTTSANGCAASGLCSNRGTVTITFNRPVRNPVLHVAGLGGSIGTVPNNSILHALGTITGSSPAGATFGAPNASAVNLSRTNGNLTFDTTDPRPSSNCGATTTGGQTSLSGCGSIPIAGTYTSITMRMDILMAPNTAGTGTAGGAGAGDAFVLGVTVPEDFGDAPATYDPGTAASHVLSDLQIGSSVDADNTGTPNAVTSPNAVAAGSSASSTNGDGIDEDGVTGAPPELLTSRIGATYSVSVPISGASSTGQLCGFIDFNRSGTFTVPGERSCAAIAVGATSVPLTWTIPSGSTSAGTTYLRLRASYNTAQAQLPTGRADSGEVEDYSISIFPTVRVNKTVLGASTRTFTLAVNGTNLSTVGNGGTTFDRKVFHTSAFGAPNIAVVQDIATTAVPLTITEAKVGGGPAQYTSTYRCVNGFGTEVASGTGTSISTSFPASTGSNGEAQNLVCTFTNEPLPLVSMTKAVQSVADTNASGRRDAGDVIGYTFTATNSGDVALTSLTINDPSASGITCPTTNLAVGGTVVCTGTHTLTQAEVDVGSFTNVATATADSFGNDGLSSTSSPSSVTVPIPLEGGLGMVKNEPTVTDSNGNGVDDAGDQVNWSFIVTNDSNATLDTLTINDPKVGTVTCATTVLAPGQTTTCTAPPYTITQAEGDAGVVTNTATATATRLIDDSPITSPVRSTSTTLTRQPQLNLVKGRFVFDRNANGVTDLGDQILWNFEIDNIGNVTVASPRVNDPLAAPVSCPSVPLPPGASMSCSVATQYTITQADVDAGVVTNTATASGEDPTGATVTSPTASTSVPVEQTSTLSLAKTAAITDVNGNGVTDLGDRIGWSFLARNTGTTTITGLAVDDPRAGTVTCPVTTLAPGAQTTCTAAAYTITQADVDAGVVSNSATASGAGVTSNVSTTDTPVTQVNGLALVKTGTVTDADGNGTDLGDPVSYAFRVTNSGTVTLTTLAILDPRVGAVSCPVTTLAPGADTTCTATGAVTQADVDAGASTNTATAQGQNPGGATVVSNSSTSSIPVPQTSAISLTKTAAVTDVDGNGTDLGDTVRWSFTVTNSGTTTMTSVAVNDPLAGAVTCAATTLAPGASTTCTSDGTYTVTQADVDAGLVVNTATANGRSPSGATVTSPSASSTTPVPQTSTLALTKAAAVTDVNGSGVTDLGDGVGWSFVVRNTGTVTLSSVGVTDPRAGTVTCPVTTLGPGAQTTCTAAAYAVTQADVDAGVVSNSATSTGRAPGGATVTSNVSSTDTPVAQVSSLSLTKSAAPVDVNGDTLINTSDRIQWSFLVRNTGTTTITTLAVADPRAGPVTCPVTTLAPGAQTTCTAVPYAVTSTDVEAGSVTNTARASGQGPGGVTVNSPTSSTTTPIDQGPAMTVTKSGTVTDVNGNGVTDLGDRIAYTFRVRNVGNVSLNTLTISDPRAGSVTCVATTLAVGAQTTCAATAPYVITQADVDAGVVPNTAQGRARSPLNAVVIAPNASTSTPVAQTSGMTLTKAAAVTDVNGNGVTDLGDRVGWSFVVRNSGTVTLSSVGVTDPRAGTVTCPTTTLAPGAQTTCTAALYTITQADVDAGVVSNSATSAGRAPQGATVASNVSTTDTPVTQSPAISLTKTAAVTDLDGNGTDLGDTIQWTFTVTNTGTVTLSTVAVSDPLAGTVTCAASSLVPGASTTCTSSGSYAITQPNVEAGQVVNTATANGRTPSGTTVTSPSASSTTPVPRTRQLALVKSVGSVSDPNGNGRVDDGEVVTYRFAVTNTGTVAVNALTINDSAVTGLSCPVTTLAPGASTTCTATRVVNGANIDFGSVSNTATASGASSAGPVSSPPSSVTLPITRQSVL